MNRYNINDENILGNKLRHYLSSFWHRNDDK